jgi:hypothetical protein
MSDIVQTLRDLADCTHSDLSVASEAADELTRLTAEVEKWKQLDREAATYVESVICLMSNRFTGNPPYVGWKGLGLALKEDYDELARLTAEVERLTAENVRLGQWDVAADERIQLIKENERLRVALEWYADEDNYYVSDPRSDLSLIDADMGVKARAALKEPRT